MNRPIAIAKGIAIILMVIGHAEVPGLLTSTLYTFHMPLFFITAGYFFNRQRTMADPWDFCAKRFRGLYLPFLKYALLFWALHNVFHYFGILNEQYGNWEGGVTHPYTWAVAGRRLIQIFTGMSGYDEFMAGAFWFFRGLLVASILFMVLFRLLDRGTKIRGNRAVWLIMAGAVAFTALRISSKAIIPSIPNGGMREIWGVFFFAMGYLYRQYENRLPSHWALWLVTFGLVVLGGHLHCSGMNNNGKLLDCLTLPLTGLMGFLMTYGLSGWIDRKTNYLSRFLVFVGSNTLYIFVFHIISFKVVSLAKIWWYGLDWHQVGCHMVIHQTQGDFFWVLYTLAGVLLPLAGLQAARAAKSYWAALRQPRLVEE